MLNNKISKTSVLLACVFGTFGIAHAADMSSGGLQIVGYSNQQPVQAVEAPQPRYIQPIQQSVPYVNNNSAPSAPVASMPSGGTVSMAPIVSPGDVGYQGSDYQTAPSVMPDNMVAPVYISPREKRMQLKREQMQANTIAAQNSQASYQAPPPLPMHNTPVNPVTLPSTPVSEPAPVAQAVSPRGEVVRTWHVTAGHTVNDILADWAEKSGWTVAFKTNQVYEIEASADFQGDFVSASSALLKSVHAEPRFKAVFHSGNKVLVVGNTFQQVE